MWCAGCKADVAVDVSPETNRARCATCGRDLALTNSRNDALSRIDASLNRDPSQIAAAHIAKPTAELDADLSSPATPNATSGLTAQLSSPLTDARQLLERWTRENILDPDGLERLRAGDDRNQAERLPALIEPTRSREAKPKSSFPTGGSSNSIASKDPDDAILDEAPPSSKPESRPPLASSPTPDVITRVVSDTTKANRPTPPKIELPPPRPRPETTRREENPLPPPEEVDEPRQSIPGPKFAERRRVTEAEHAPPETTLEESSVQATSAPSENVAIRRNKASDRNDLPESAAAVTEPVKNKPTFRIDASHPRPGDQSLDMAFSSPGDDDVSPRAVHRPPSDFSLPRGDEPVSRQVHAPHPHLTGAHFDVQSMIRPPSPEKPSQSTQSVFGQILAYLGVGVLTLGAGCVLWGYFGAAQYSHLAPTGWLITTAGQMLLFLGVVTLIAGGLEQTNTLVNQRLDTWERKWMELNGHTYRVDPPTSQAMGQGPHVPAEVFRDRRIHSQAHSSETRL